MPKINIQNAGLTNTSALQDPAFETVSPDLTVARALEQQGGILAQAGRQLESFGAEQVMQYKKAKDADYVTSSYITADQTLRNLVENEKAATAANPEGYTKNIIKGAESVYDKLIKDAPSIESQRVLKSQLDQHKYSLYTESSKYEKDMVSSFRIGKYQENIKLLSNSIGGDIDNLDNVIGQNNQLLDSLRMTGVAPDKIAELQRRSTELFSRSLLKQMNPAEGLKLLNSGALDTSLDELQQESLKNDLDRKIKEELIIADKQYKQAQENQMNSLKVGIYAGEIKESDIQDLLINKQIDNEQFLDLVKSFNGEIGKKADEAYNLKLVGSLITNGKGINPEDKDLMKSYDTYYKTVVEPSLVSLDPVSQERSIIDFINKNGAIPQTVLKNTLASLNSADPTSKIRAASLITNMSDANPATLRNFKNEDIAFAVKLNELSSLLPAEEAILAAQTQIYKKDDPIYKQKLSAFKETASLFNPDEINTDWFPNAPLIGGNPRNVPASMEADFNNLYQTFAVDQGLPDNKAQEMAYKVLTTQYGITTISGEPEYMRAAPESFYGVKGKDNSWIRQDLVNDLSTLGINAEDEDTRIELQPIRSTLNSNKPQYTVMVFRGDTFEIPKDANGRALAWSPDVKKQYDKEQKEAASIKQTLIDKMTIKVYNKLDDKGFTPPPAII